MEKSEVLIIIENDFRDKVSRLDLKTLNTFKWDLLRSIGNYKGSEDIFVLKINIIDYYISELEKIRFDGSYKDSKIARLKYNNNKRKKARYL